jgi:mannose-6-phosphate isomerase-like protein (cupin superfamily)
MEESGVRINCYEAGASDEMHCHPGSEHSFLVWKGRLHITGVEDGEDVIVGPGEFVQIDAGYYYRLHNPGPEPAVYVQFHSIRAKQPLESTVLFSQSARGKRAAAEGAV